MSTLALSSRPPARRVGLALSALAAAFLVLDAGVKLAGRPEAVEATAQLGWAPSALPALGGLLLACLVLYLVPRTAVLGAVLLTGYLGGAVAAHVRVGNPLLTHALFPVYVAALVWAGLLLRDADLRRFLLHAQTPTR